MMKRNVLKLRSGDEIPVVGLGLWKVPNSDASRLVVEAAEAGYRHFDCACDYGNEVEVGVGLRNVVSSGVARRDELWVTSKLWNTYHAPEHVGPALERTLGDLGLDYLDLYLIHFPIALAFVPFDKRYPPGWFFDPNGSAPAMKPASVPIAETWRAMEEVVRRGLVKNIGVCNFGVALLRDLLSYAEVQPTVLQVESHPYLTHEKLLRFCKEEGIVFTAFSPLGAASYFSLGMASEEESLVDHASMRAIGERHGRTPAQVALRWGIQRGTSVIPKTTRTERLRENLAVFDFQLSDEEMVSIDSLNRNRRFNDPGVFCEEAFNTFFPIYE